MNRPPASARSSRRLCGLIRKETLQILRDPSSIAIAFVLPFVLLLIFGYGVSLDAEHVPVGLVADQSSPETAGFLSEFAQSRYFATRSYPDIHTAEAAMMTGEIDAIVWLRGNFSSELLSWRSPTIGVFINGVNANNARIIQGYIEGAWSVWLERYAAARGVKFSIPVEVQNRIWYNPRLRSRDFIVPGLIAVIMTLIGALLTAMVVAREWERGTMESLMVTPVTVREILLGKLVPYFVLGMGGLVLSVIMGIWLFHVPLNGSVLVLLAASALFLLVALGMGLLISTVARNQFVAGQVAIIVTFMPAFMLSGFIFDIGSMPWPIKGLTHVIAARYYVAILQTVFLAGNVWSVILPNMAALIVMGLVFFALVRRRTRKRLD
jgi:ABC-2 type transport system permease protein